MKDRYEFKEIESKWQKIWASGNGRSRFEADDEYSAGADNIDNSIDETVKIDGEIKDATSEKDESPADGTSPTTAKWENIWKAGKGRSRFEAETEGEGETADGTAAEVCRTATQGTVCGGGTPRTGTLLGGWLRVGHGVRLPFVVWRSGVAAGLPHGGSDGAGVCPHCLQGNNGRNRC